MYKSLDRLVVRGNYFVFWTRCYHKIVVARKKLIATSLIIVTLAIVSFVSLGIFRHKERYSPPSHQAIQTTISKKPLVVQGLSYIFVIVEENQPYSNLVGNANAPYINYLIKRYSSATNYYAVAHPSLPNYLALTSGSTDGITTDCNPPSAGCVVNVPNIADEIEKSGRSWKAYAESMPSPCYAYNSNEYATKHNPFIYYSDIISNQSSCTEHVVPFSQLSTDLALISTTPNYAFITPNLCNDMHNCSIATGDTWLAKNVPIILQSKAFSTQNSLLIITWDEGYATTNHVLALLVGNSVKQNYQSSQYYSHYSVLHTIETAWNLAPLTNNDKQAKAMGEFLNNNSVL